MNQTALNAPSLPGTACAAEPASPDGKRILLVEGDGFTRLVLLLRLRLAGFAVDFTSNGTLGLGKLRSCRPDILLIELKLCGMSGLELIKAARAEAGFGDRPIYVFTHAQRMNRATRKEVASLATEVFDKATITREDLVQIFSAKYSNQQNPSEVLPEVEGTQVPNPALSEPVLSGALEELIAGVREQAEALAGDSGGRISSGSELLSRVSSLGSCAKAVGSPNLARHCRALEHVLQHLSKDSHGYTDSILHTIATAVEVMSAIALQSRDKQQLQRFSAVYIDESSESNQAMERALIEAEFHPICFTHPATGREYLACHRTAIIIANVSLPEAHGLAFAEIRQLSLHVATPVLFAPEPAAQPQRGEDLPTSAPRLDRNPVLMAELVLKALNEVQRAKTGVVAQPLIAATKQPVASAPVARPNSAASLPPDDGFTLFARGPSKEQTSAPDSPTPPAAVALPPIQQLKRFDELFLDASIPNEPILRADNSAQQGDLNAEEIPVEPALHPDATQLEEQPLEAPPGSASQPEISALPQPEITAEDQTAQPIWYAAPDSEDAQLNGLETSLENNQAAPAEELAVAAPNDGETMNYELQAAPAEPALEAEPLPAGEPSPEQHNSRDELAARVCTAEMALYHAQQEIQDKAAAIAALEEQLAQAKVAQSEPPVPPAVAPSDKPEQSSTGQALKASPNANGALPAVAPSVPAFEPWAGATANELEQQVRQGVAALARATAELAQERGERLRAQQLAADLNARLLALHDDLSRTIKVQGEHLTRIAGLEKQNQEAQESLERCSADLEEHQSERQLIEAELQKAKETNDQLRKDLAFFDQSNKKFGGASQDLQERLESSLAAARQSEMRLQQEVAERQRLAQSLEEAQAELQAQVRRRELLEQELKGAHETLQEREARLAREIAERRRLNQSFDTTHDDSLKQPERDLEFSKLQTALHQEEIERKRQESQLAQMRQRTLDSANAARALRTSMRRQIREPIDNLVHSTRSLLELGLDESQKKLAEAVLQDVLLVQTRLREPAPAAADTAEESAPSTPSAP